MSSTDIRAQHDDVLNQSSATWRHSNIKYTFPRSSRFHESVNINNSMYDLKSPMSDKACGIGFGEKYYIPIWEKRKMNEVPGPDRYGSFARSARSTRRSFSKSNRFLQDTRGLPGPGAYEASFSMYAKGITMKGRFPEGKLKPHPSPAEYTLNDPHSSAARPISIKVRLRDVSIPITPGPGSYNICNWPKTAKGKRRVSHQMTSY